MRFKPSLVSTLLTLCLLAPALAQRPASPAAPPQDDADVVRVTTNLVQVDVIATDRRGRPVTDLRPEEFTVYQDGKEQELTNFSFVAVEPAAGTEASAPPPPSAPKSAKNLPPAPAPRPGQIRRTVALVVDDLAMSFGSIDRVRDGLRKFVDEQMRPGDLVGIYRTRGGSGALQQFTSDRAQLHRAIDAIRWRPAPFGGNRIDEFEPLRDDRGLDQLNPQNQRTFEDGDTRGARERDEDRNRDLVAYGALGTLRFVLNGMRFARGRRSVVLFGSGLPLYTRTGDTLRARQALDRVVETANRAGVVVYTVDARGVLDPTFVSAADNPPPDIDSTLNARVDRLTESRRAQEGFYVLAEETGGLFLHTKNNLEEATRQILTDQGGYYLLGYRPSEETFRKGRGAFNLSVKVSRPDVSVRTRTRFAALTEDEARREARGSDRELYSLLASPVTAGEMYVRMTAGFVERASGSGAARMLLHIDGAGLTFADAPDGTRKLVLDVAAVTLGADGKIVDEFTRTHTVRVPPDAAEHIRRHGLTYTADVPVKSAGTYQLRIAVRDQPSQRLGSAGQLIDVPDLKRRRLTVSGLTLRQAQPGETPGPKGAAAATAETALAPVLTSADPAVRRFQPGSVLVWNYQVFNAEKDAAGRPRLKARVQLFMNGEAVLTGEPSAVELDPARGWAEGGMRLSPNAKPGEYVLQIVVTDEAGKGRQASQWIDFEVVR